MIIIVNHKVKANAQRHAKTEPEGKHSWSVAIPHAAARAPVNEMFVPLKPKRERARVT